MKKILSICLALCIIFALTACGAGGGDTTTPQGTQNQGQQGGTTPQAQGGGGGGDAVPTAGHPDSIFRVTQTVMPRIDPALATDFASNIIFINVYDSLVFPTPDGNVIPWVAESWTTSDDGRQWYFTLRQDVFFHSGNKLTAHDVVYSMERLLTIGEGYAFLFFTHLESVEAISDYVVRFTTYTPYGPFLNSLVRFYILDSELMMANHVVPGDFGDMGDYGRTFLLENSAGSGPYFVESVATNISVTGRKFQDYWAGHGPNVPERFIVFSSNDPVTVRTAMSRQEQESADMWQTTENIAAMLASDDTLALAYNYTGGGLNLFMNNQRPPLDCVYVRQAMGYLIDYDTVLNHILPGSRLKTSVIPSNLLGHTPTFNFEFNPERARAILANSRYANDIGNMSIDLIWNSESADREKVALMIQAAAMQIGLTINIVELPWSSIVANSADVNTSPMMSLVSITPVTSDAGAQFVAMFRSRPVGTWESQTWAMDPVLDEMIDAAVTIVDINARAEAYREIQRYVAERFMFIPMTESPERLVHQASYVYLNPQIGMQGFSFYFPHTRVYPERRR